MRHTDLALIIILVVSVATALIYPYYPEIGFGRDIALNLLANILYDKIINKSRNDNNDDNDDDNNDDFGDTS